MTKKELFEKFDGVASIKTSIAISCIKCAKTTKEAKWHATETEGQLQGLYRGYTDVGELCGVCRHLDREFLKRMFEYKNMIDEELAMYIVKKTKQKK